MHEMLAQFSFTDKTTKEQADKAKTEQDNILSQQCLTLRWQNLWFGHLCSGELRALFITQSPMVSQRHPIYQPGWMCELAAPCQRPGAWSQECNVSIPVWTCTLIYTQCLLSMNYMADSYSICTLVTLLRLHKTCVCSSRHREFPRNVFQQHQFHSL